MNVNVFNDQFLDPLLQKISNENKNVFLAGDFNINLLNFETDNPSSSFLNNLTSNLFIPHITLPTRITSRSRTLIDNIFSNTIDFQSSISGNITSSISDHFPQFLLVPSRQNNYRPRKHNMFHRNMRNFDPNSFERDLSQINWNELIKANEDPNYSFDNFYSSVEKLLNKHAPLVKLSKKEFKQQLKPWITSGIRKSMKYRDNLLNKYINCKNLENKENLFANYKTYRNYIVKLTRQNKNNHYIYIQGVS